ncbi:hypothetical protein ACIQTT_10355 [Microbacterium sp. NPDC090225]|uniref:hypothetical protein n=1 Tax=Microbacterium sp. NPDC090225 TaxID=3364207 RepID=UPI0037FB53A2
MTLTDDRLDELFALAHPSPARDTALRAQDIALRERIIRGDVAPRPAPHRRGFWAAGLTTAVASCAIIALIAVNVLAPDQRAVALTPPPLVYTDAEPLDAVVADAHAALADGDGPAQAPHVEVVTWGWSIDMSEKNIEVIPQDITMDWTLDEGGVTTIVAGEPYWEDGERPAGLGESPYEPGELIDRVTMTPEQFNIPPATAALDGSSRDELEAAVAPYLSGDPDPTSGEIATGIVSLLWQWTLTDEQHATLLDMLVDAGGVTVLGRTTDRLGRDVVGLEVTAPLNSLYRITVLVSRDTGRIVGTEDELTEPLDFIPAGVTGYTLWDEG